MSLTGKDKTASSSLVGTDKTAATMSNMTKSGKGWDYNEVGITYDGSTDSHGREVFYNSVGEATTLTGLDKTSA